MPRPFLGNTQRLKEFARTEILCIPRLRGHTRVSLFFLLLPYPPFASNGILPYYRSAESLIPLVNKKADEPWWASYIPVCVRIEDPPRVAEHFRITRTRRFAVVIRIFSRVRPPLHTNACLLFFLLLSPFSHAESFTDTVLFGTTKFFSPS